MDEQGKGGSGIPIGGLVVLVALIMGVVVGPQLPFRGSRPTTIGEVEVSQVSREKVQARLWEDPFAAVQHYFNKFDSQEKLAASQRKKYDLEHAVEDIIKNCSSKNDESTEIQVIMVMVPGGPYGEDAEQRLRSREAVISALGELDYIPKDPKHIGYMDLSLGEAEVSPFAFPKFIPYEWFIAESGQGNKLLLMWLNDDYFGEKPLKKIANIIKLGKVALGLFALGDAVHEELLWLVDEREMMGNDGGANDKKKIEPAILERAIKGAFEKADLIDALSKVLKISNDGRANDKKKIEPAILEQAIKGAFEKADFIDTLSKVLKISDDGGENEKKAIEADILGKAIIRAFKKDEFEAKLITGLAGESKEGNELRDLKFLKAFLRENNNLVEDEIEKLFSKRYASYDPKQLGTLVKKKYGEKNTDPISIGKIEKIALGMAILEARYHEMLLINMKHWKGLKLGEKSDAWQNVYKVLAKKPIETVVKDNFTLRQDVLKEIDNYNLHEEGLGEVVACELKEDALWKNFEEVAVPEEMSKGQAVLVYAILMSECRQALGYGVFKAFNVPEIKVQVIGPSDSGKLKEMVREMQEGEPHDSFIEDVHIFSPRAVAAEERLLQGDENDNYEYVTTLFRDKFGENSSFLRTTSTDEVLTDELVYELERRGVNFLKDHIVLVSEYDTFYGRALPETFTKSFCEKRCKETVKKQGHWCFSERCRKFSEEYINYSCNKKCEKPSEEHIHRFSYLYGLDGNLPKESPKKDSLALDRGKKDAKRTSIERPVGYGQLDYLRRLASDLEQLDEKLKGENIFSLKPLRSGIRAIGVLGSDVYDKILIFQALRERFPDTIFFTTDLDALLFHPDEYKWTRNVVVASSFGLELSPERQKETLPFRDTYQTALFFSTKLAVDSKNKEITQEELNKQLMPARIFEVGRSGFYDLSQQNTNTIEKDSALGKKFTLEDIHPRPDKFSTNKSLLSLLTGLFLIGAFLPFYIFFLSKPLPTKPGVTDRWLFLTSHYWVMLPLLIVIPAFGLFIYFGKEVYEDEPWALFEGISIWPTELLLFLSSLLSIYFLRTGYVKLRNGKDAVSALITGKSKPEEDTTDEGFMESFKSWIFWINEILFTKRKKEDRKEKFSYSSELWEKYQKRIDPKYCARRIILLSFLGFILCAFTVIVFGFPQSPFRGTGWFYEIFIKYRFSLGIAVACLIVLLVWVADTTIQTAWLVYSLSKKKLAWPLEVKQLLGMDQLDPCLKQDINNLINIKVIAEISQPVDRLIYYPFLVMILIMLAHNNYFDNWNLTVGVVIVTLVLLSFLIYCSIVVRTLAKPIKVEATEELRTKQFKAKVEDNKILRREINSLLNSIVSTHRGAFVPFFQQPWVRAVGLFLGGGGIVLLEYFAKR